MRTTLQAEVDAVEVRTVNDNSGLVTVFERIINTSEEHRILIAEALWTEGEAARAQGKTAVAVALFQQAMDARGADLCADSKARRDRVIVMRQHLLVAHGAVDEREEVETEQTAQDKLELAYDLEDRGDYAAAVVLYQEAIAVFTAVSGGDSLGLAKSYAGIGITCVAQGQCTEGNDAQGKYAEALEYQQKSLAIRIRVLGHDHVTVAGSYNNIAHVYGKQRKYAEALEYQHKSLAIQIRVLGLDNLDVAGSYNNLGSVYATQGKHAEALEYFQKSLATLIRVLGHDHVQVARSYGNLGYVYRGQGRITEAKEMFTKTYDIFLKVLGPDHQDTQQFKRDLDKIRGGG